MPSRSGAWPDSSDRKPKREPSGKTGKKADDRRPGQSVESAPAIKRGTSPDLFPSVVGSVDGSVHYSEPTTLQLARLIADEVIAAQAFGQSSDDRFDPPTQAVLAVLHATRSWFCRWVELEDGTTDDSPRLPFDIGPKA